MADPHSIPTFFLPSFRFRKLIKYILIDPVTDAGLTPPPPPPRPLPPHNTIPQRHHQCSNTTNILLVITVMLCSPPPVGYLVTLNGFVAPPDVVTVISRYRSRTLTISRITPRVALFIVQFHNSLSPDQVALLRPPLEPGPRLTAPDGS